MLHFVQVEGRTLHQQRFRCASFRWSGTEAAVPPDLHNTPKPEGHQGHGSQLWEVKEGITEEVTTEFSLGGLVGGHQANPVKEGRKAIGGRDQLRRT